MAVVFTVRSAGIGHIPIIRATDMLQSIVSLTVNIRVRLCFPVIEHDLSFQEPAHKASARVIGIGVAGASTFHEPSTIRSVTTVLVGHM